ncbi:MAG: hypothetical protein V4621_07100 [Pseudomonadota bacterium]
MTLEQLKETIGLRTFGTLMTMLALTLGVSALCFLFVLPQTDAQLQKLQQARQVVDSKRAEIRTLRQEYADLQTFMGDFKSLEKRGFFKEQNRIIARRALDQMIADAGLIDLDYEIRPARVISEVRVDIPLPAAGATPGAMPGAGPVAATAQTPNMAAGNQQPVNNGYALIESEVSMDISTYDDVQIYNFIKRLTDTFQGRMVLRSLDIEPVAELNQANYLKIGNGEAVSLVQGRAVLMWYSMVPADKAPPLSQGGS